MPRNINKKSRNIYKKKNKSVSFIPKSIKQPKDPRIKITNAKINEENSGNIQKVSQVNNYRKK